jgi:hypothetical protein
MAMAADAQAGHDFRGDRVWGTRFVSLLWTSTHPPG